MGYGSLLLTIGLTNLPSPDWCGTNGDPSTVSKLVSTRTYQELKKLKITQRSIHLPESQIKGPLPDR